MRSKTITGSAELPKTLTLDDIPTTRKIFQAKASPENFDGFDTVRALLKKKKISPNERVALMWRLTQHWEFCSAREFVKIRNENGLMAGRYPFSNKAPASTPVHSCSILRNVVIDDRTFDVWFCYGVPDEFPEYEIGDSIDWKLHERKFDHFYPDAMKNMVCIGKLFESPEKNKDEKHVAITITDGVIERACWLEDEATVSVNGAPYLTYLDGAAYCVSPLDDFFDWFDCK